jgi:signal transduction histidine kinase
MFVRQLEGTLALLPSDGAGTIVSIEFPLHADP